MAHATYRNRLRNHLGDVDSLVDHFFGSSGLSSMVRTRPPASFWEDGDKYHIELDVPGATHDDIELTYDKGALTIAVERRAPEAAGREGWHDERSYGKFSRVATLPDTVDPESIEAGLAAGVLHVTLTKRPEAQPKRIEIRDA